MEGLEKGVRSKVKLNMKIWFLPYMIIRELQSLLKDLIQQVQKWFEWQAKYLAKHIYIYLKHTHIHGTKQHDKTSGNKY